MAVFLLNICKFNKCGMEFGTLVDLIQHIEENHIGKLSPVNNSRQGHLLHRPFRRTKKATKNMIESIWKLQSTCSHSPSFSLPPKQITIPSRSQTVFRLAVFSVLSRMRRVRRTRSSWSARALWSRSIVRRTLASGLKSSGKSP